MVISELIAHLEALKAEHGDLVCVTLERDESGGDDGHYDLWEPGVVERTYAREYPEPVRPASCRVVTLSYGGSFHH
jgi:hypothetical protein